MSPVRSRRSIRLIAVAGAAILAGTFATTASAAVRPTPRVATITRDGQQIRLRTTGAASPRTPTGAAAAIPHAPARFDLDGDGIDEVVAGAFCGPMGYCLVVRYSRSSRTDWISPPITSPTRPNFGDVLTAGDFNRDGYLDLAVSNEGEFVPALGNAGAFGGAVWVFYGGPDGLDAGTVQHFNLDTPGIPYAMQAYGMFGSALAAGDLNGDAYADLAIGAYGESVDGLTASGLVTVLYGGSAGLTTTGVQALTESTAGVSGPTRAQDAFGSALAIGDVTGDGYADLAVGAVNASFSASTNGGSGMVVLLRGSASGLTATGSSAVYGARDVQVSTLGDLLAIADVNGDGHADVLAPTPRSSGGALVYLPGTANGIGAAGARVITQDTPGVPGEIGGPVGNYIAGFFASSIATGDVTGDGLPDVLLGAIGTDIDGILDAGAVYLIPGSRDGLTGAGSVEYWQGMRTGSPGTRDQPTPNPVSIGYYGHSVAILNLDGTGGLDPLVGTDFETASNGLVQRLFWTTGPTVVTTRGVFTPPAHLAPGPYLTGDSLGVYSVGSTLLHG
jgi:hypothetical protein